VTRRIPDASTSEFRVRYSETDQMGVVYHTNYLVWCEIGRTDFIRGSGATYAELERRGVLLAVSEATIRYHSAARYDDLIRVETTLVAVRSRAVTFDYLITNGETGERLASARTALVSLDTSGRPAKLPDDFRRRLEERLTMSPRPVA
jgi:acyl-CoA thioester hydrolase